jgi:hypothetical protein
MMAVLLDKKLGYNVTVFEREVTLVTALKAKGSDFICCETFHQLGSLTRVWHL